MSKIKLRHFYDYSPETALKDLFEGINSTLAIYYFNLPEKAVHAAGIDGSSGFIVLPGSTMATYCARTLSQSYRSLRDVLIRAKSVIPSDHSENFIFAQPYCFKNEFVAGCILAGNCKFRTRSGIWVDINGNQPHENRLRGHAELTPNTYADL